MVEDDPIVARVMRRVLQEDFDIHHAENLSSASEELARLRFDVILLDINLPGESGLRLCEQLKSDPLHRHVPIILVTGMDGSDNIVNGLRQGADDYLAKPFHVPELIARVEAVIRRSSVNLDANPLTRLPGNGVIEREIHRHIESKHFFSVLYVDLNEFKAYNDYYGFHQGDLVIKKTALILSSVVTDAKSLVAHVGGDDFIVVTQREDIEVLCQEMIQRFNDIRREFYDAHDFETGFIMTRDRLGTMRQIPLLSIAIGVVSNRIRLLHSIGEISTIGAEVKGIAKRQKGSAYFIDRRGTPYPGPQQGLNLCADEVVP